MDGPKEERFTETHRPTEFFLFHPVQRSKVTDLLFLLGHYNAKHEESDIEEQITVLLSSENASNEIYGSAGSKPTRKTPIAWNIKRHRKVPYQ